MFCLFSGEEAPWIGNTVNQILHKISSNLRRHCKNDYIFEKNLVNARHPLVVKHFCHIWWNSAYKIEHFLNMKVYITEIKADIKFFFSVSWRDELFPGCNVSTIAVNHRSDQASSEFELNAGGIGAWGCLVLLGTTVLSCGLTLVGYQVPTKAALLLPASHGQGRETVIKGLWTRIRTGRLLTIDAVVKMDSAWGN